jgi:nitroimidazol reductase NimA-like FMN-containing flavoprotein (pyridoxamine 5'-phosphate oxidase superfamily)
MPRAQLPLTDLSASDCWKLLARHRPALGRVAFTIDEHPVIYPMNYAVADETLYLRTEPDSGIAAVSAAQLVAFEVDDVDDDWEAGWSVLVQGRLEEVTDPQELDRHRELRLRSWAPGVRLHLVRLDPERISGREIG